MAAQEPAAVYACVCRSRAYAPRALEGRAICLAGDIAAVLEAL